jgi:flagellar biosynthesis protein FlhB
MTGRVPPTPRRLREARARGEVAYAPTLTAAAALAGGALALGLTARPAAARLVALARETWGGAAGDAVVAGQGAASTLAPTLLALAWPVAAAVFAAALVAGLAQTRFNFAWGALGRWRDEPEPWVATSFAAAAALVLVMLAGGRTLVAALARADGAAAAASVTATALGSLAARALVVVALAGLGEFAWRRAQLTEALSMSRAEAERERREDEGDPRLRAEQRRRQRALARDPLVDDVARAGVVVTTEGVAVALRLVDGSVRVAAAGDERLRAARIADVARRLGIAVRADDVLAAPLAALPAGSTVPPELQTRALAALRAVRRTVTYGA